MAFYNNQQSTPVQPNQSQGWQNPYNQPYTTLQAMQNPSLAQINNVGQQTMTSQVPPPVQGHVITSVDDIKPSEVPMDTSISLFPLSDYTVIYAKQWDRNGVLQEVRYFPEQPANNVKEQSNDISNTILQRLDAIERKLDQRPYYKKPYNNKPRKNEEHKEDSK